MGWEKALMPIGFSLFYYAIRRVLRIVRAKYNEVQYGMSSEEKPMSRRQGTVLEKMRMKRGKRDPIRDAKYVAIVMGLVLLLTLGVFGWNYWRYGPLFFVSPEKKKLSLSSVEWQHLLKNRSVVFVGGHHRAGTTVVWRCVASHPDAAWFGEERESGLDFSEGVFAQDVYPRFGIGEEFSFQTLMGRETGGIGRYALVLDTKDVLWTEERATSDVQARILNRWGYLWDRKPPGIRDARVFVEKSPIDVVLARFLQAMVDVQESTPKRLPVEKEFFDAANHRPVDSRARFLFVTRHPIAVALSQYDFGAKIAIKDLIAHWLAIENYARANARHLARVTTVRLEDFAADPGAALADLWRFLDLPPAPVDVVRTVRPDPNAHHKATYCERLQTDTNFAAQHRSLVAAFNAKVQDFGYDLDDFCGSAQLDDDDFAHGPDEL